MRGGHKTKDETHKIFFLLFQSMFGFEI